MELVKVRPAAFQDQQLIAGLIKSSPYVHRHLDWRNPLDWIGTPPYFVLEDQGRVVAVLGCPPDPPGVAWLRLFAASESIDLDTAWSSLWEAARLYLGQRGQVLAAAIALLDWQVSLLQNSGFTTHQSIVMLVREPSGRLAVDAQLEGEVSIRAMRFYDLQDVAQVDSAAFEPLWRNTLDTLNRAFPQAMIASVAEIAGRVAGYQISTRTPFGAHLARLAVLPEAQGHGVGYRLVADLVQQADQLGLSRLTVNTQSDNATSLALYQKAGFQPNGENYPVFQMQVP